MKTAPLEKNDKWIQTVRFKTSLEKNEPFLRHTSTYTDKAKLR